MPLPYTEVDNLAATDDSKLAHVKEDAKRMKAIGEIIINVFRKASHIKQYFTTHAGFDSSATSPVHEKALKGDAKSHSIS